MVLAAGCGRSEAAPTFALAVQNGSDLEVRLAVVVRPGEKPANTLRIPPGSGLLETVETPMQVTGSDAVPVVVQIYTGSCGLLDSVTVGSGATLIVIHADRSLTTSATTLSKSSGAVAPELAPAC